MADFQAERKRNVHFCECRVEVDVLENLFQYLLGRCRPPGSQRRQLPTGRAYHV